MNYEEKLRRDALEHLYVADEVPAQLAPHLIWQSPLMLAKPGEPWECTEPRVRHAGELWIRNTDLRPYAQLVICHRERPWSILWQRAMSPGDRAVMVGPLPMQLLRKGARTLLGLPLSYLESEKAMHPAVCRELAGPGAGPDGSEGA